MSSRYGLPRSASARTLVAFGKPWSPSGCASRACPVAAPPGCGPPAPRARREQSPGG